MKQVDFLVKDGTRGTCTIENDKMCNAVISFWIEELQR